MVIRATKNSYRLLHQGTLTLSKIEANGIKIDRKQLKRSFRKADARIAELQESIKQTEVYERWQSRYGKSMKLSSGPQLASILYEEMGYPVLDYTQKEQPSTAKETLEKIPDPFIENFLKIKAWNTVKNTFLKGVQKNLVNGWLHTNFNLNTVVTYRGSSNDPNLQNIPIRIPEFAEVIRSVFVPESEDRMLIEVDYSGIEVRIAACYHKDPMMLSYIRDPSKDMHRDMAAQIYCIDKDDVSKTARYCAKNMFVFPSFYGDYYIHSALAMWAAIPRMDLQTPDGTSLKKVLKSKGIISLGLCDPKKKPVKGTFEYHMREIENDFWNNRFKVYGRWKKKWYADYLENGGFTTLTGFRIEGLYSRNDVINYPVQGSAFHCLLWSLIQLQKEIEKRGMKTKLRLQIHDSILADVPVKEKEMFLELVQEIMIDRLMKKWSWLIVPVEIEAEAAPPGKSWFEKKAVELN